MTSCFIIPAYEPNQHLLLVVQELIKKTNAPLVVVDDGSKDKSIFQDPLFSNPRLTLLTHASNLGKGAALKTAFNVILVQYPHLNGCITLDADGQHSVKDAIAISHAMEESHDLILGVRSFSFKDKSIPLKSRIGNLLTRSIWRLVTGNKVTDTQTGLRGIPARLMKECLHIGANRYEFEMEMLLKTQKIGMRTHEMPIETIYIDNNRESHFNPLFDSLKIYFVIFRFFASSLFSCFIDYLAFSIFIVLFSFSISTSFILGRLISGLVNYNINKTAVFGLKHTNKMNFFKYVFIFILNIYLGVVFIRYIELHGYNAFSSKIVVESVLFFFNFFLQREWVFKRETSTS